MTLNPIPKMEIAAGQKWHIRADVLKRWEPDIRAASTDDNTISILDVIGEDSVSYTHLTLPTILLV